MLMTGCRDFAVILQVRIIFKFSENIFLSDLKINNSLNIHISILLDWIDSF